MNEIVQLHNAIAEVEKREAWLKTNEGILEAEKEMLKIFNALNAYGYRLPDADEQMMAKLWASSLKEYIGLYGTGLIKRAVVNFAESDTREYRNCPMVGDIIAEIKKIGKNPRAELARIESEREIAEIDRKHKEENEKAWENLPDEKKRKIEDGIKAMERGEIDIATLMEDMFDG